MSISDLKRKADSGNVVSQCVLGICYLDGIDVAVNYKEAFRLLSGAAAQGASRAKANLARMYAEGLGVPIDPRMAHRLYLEAADSGEFFAQIQLGRIYSRGLGVPIDRDAALKWYSRAASQQATVEDCDELQEAQAYLSSSEH